MPLKFPVQYCKQSTELNFTSEGLEWVYKQKPHTLSVNNLLGAIQVTETEVVCLSAVTKSRCCCLLGETHLVEETRFQCSNGFLSSHVVGAVKELVRRECFSLSLPQQPLVVMVVMDKYANSSSRRLTVIRNVLESFGCSVRIDIIHSKTATEQLQTVVAELDPHSAYGVVTLLRDAQLQQFTTLLKQTTPEQQLRRIPLGAVMCDSSAQAKNSFTRSLGFDENWPALLRSVLRMATYYRDEIALFGGDGYQCVTPLITSRTAPPLLPLDSRSSTSSSTGATVATNAVHFELADSALNTSDTSTTSGGSAHTGATLDSGGSNRSNGSMPVSEMDSVNTSFSSGWPLMTPSHPLFRRVHRDDEPIVPRTPFTVRLERAIERHGTSSECTSIET